LGGCSSPALPIGSLSTPSHGAPADTKTPAFAGFFFSAWSALASAGLVPLAQAVKRGRKLSPRRKDGFPT
jgi:hypothetical protein